MVWYASSSAAVSGNILEEYFLSFRIVSAIVYRVLNVVRFLLRWDRVLLFQLTRSIPLIGASSPPSLKRRRAMTAKVSSSLVMMLSLRLICLAYLLILLKIFRILAVSVCSTRMIQSSSFASSGWGCSLFIAAKVFVPHGTPMIPLIAIFKLRRRCCPSSAMSRSLPGRVMKPMSAIGTALESGMLPTTFESGSKRISSKPE